MSNPKTKSFNRAASNTRSYNAYNSVPAQHLHLPDTQHWYPGEHCMNCRAVYIADTEIEVVQFDFDNSEIEVAIPNWTPHNNA